MSFYLREGPFTSEVPHLKKLDTWWRRCQDKFEETFRFYSLPDNLIKFRDLSRLRDSLLKVLQALVSLFEFGIFWSFLFHPRGLGLFRSAGNCRISDVDGRAGGGRISFSKTFDSLPWACTFPKIPMSNHNPFHSIFLQLIVQPSLKVENSRNSLPLLKPISNQFSALPFSEQSSL